MAREFGRLGAVPTGRVPRPATALPRQPVCVSSGSPATGSQAAASRSALAVSVGGPDGWRSSRPSSARKCTESLTLCPARWYSAKGPVPSLLWTWPRATAARIRIVRGSVSTEASLRLGPDGDGSGMDDPLRWLSNTCSYSIAPEEDERNPFSPPSTVVDRTTSPDPATLRGHREGRSPAGSSERNGASVVTRHRPRLGNGFQGQRGISTPCRTSRDRRRSLRPRRCWSR